MLPYQSHCIIQSYPIFYLQFCQPIIIYEYHGSINPADSLNWNKASASHLMFYTKSTIILLIGG